MQLTTAEEQVMQYLWEIKEGYGPFQSVLGGISIDSRDEDNNPRRKTYIICMLMFFIVLSQVFYLVYCNVSSKFPCILSGYEAKEYVRSLGLL